MKHIVSAVAVAALLVLGGCAQDKAKRADEAASQSARRYSHLGYQGEHAYSFTTAKDSWTLGAETVEVALMLPTGAGPFPVVIYLPGLGESAEAGVAWRRTWAEAGYGVVSLQSAAAAGLWTSQRARYGDFRSMAREQFSAKALAQRLDLVLAALARLHSLQDGAGLAEFRRLDLSRVALAGYDLGAQTAMALAGARVPGRDSTPVPAEVKAVLALSPYADFSGMATQEVFLPVGVPVLSVTSHGDTDAYGLVTTPAVRRAPFQYMPAGNKWLLVLFSADHGLLSGRDTPGMPEGADAAPKAEAEPGGGPTGGKRGGRRGRSDGTRGGEPSGGKRGGGEGMPRGADWRLEQARIASVSSAFLDSMLKQDEFAREWLQRDALRWLDGAAELQSK